MRRGSDAGAVLSERGRALTARRTSLSLRSSLRRPLDPHREQILISNSDAIIFSCPDCRVSLPADCSPYVSRPHGRHPLNVQGTVRLPSVSQRRAGNFEHLVNISVPWLI